MVRELFWGHTSRLVRSSFVGSQAQRWGLQGSKRGCLAGRLLPMGSAQLSRLWGPVITQGRAWPNTSGKKELDSQPNQWGHPPWERNTQKWAAQSRRFRYVSAGISTPAHTYTDLIHWGWVGGVSLVIR